MYVVQEPQLEPEVILPWASLEKWARFQSLKNVPESDILVKSEGEAQGKTERNPEVLEQGRRSMKRSIVHSEPTNQINSPMDFSVKDLTTLSIPQLLRKANFKRIDE